MSILQLGKLQQNETKWLKYSPNETQSKIKLLRSFGSGSQSGAIFSLKGHLAMSGDILDCHDCG